MFEGRRNTDRPFKTTRDSFADGLRFLIDDVDHRGNLDDYLQHELDKSIWHRILNNRICAEFGDFNCRFFEHDKGDNAGDCSETPRKNTSAGG